MPILDQPGWQAQFRTGRVRRHGRRHGSHGDAFDQRSGMFLRARDLNALRPVARIDVRDGPVVARGLKACEAERTDGIGPWIGGGERRSGGLARGRRVNGRPRVRHRRHPLGGARLGPGCGHCVDICQGFIQVPDAGADHLSVLLHLVEDHQLGFHRGAELAVNLSRHREGQARRQETASARPMRGIAFGRESRRHDRHQPPAMRETLCSRNEMFGGDVLVAGSVDRRGEGRVHHHDVG